MKRITKRHEAPKLDDKQVNESQAVQSSPAPVPATDNATNPAGKEKRKGRFKRAMSGEARDRMVAEQRARWEKIMADRREHKQLSASQSRSTASTSPVRTKARARVLTPEARAHLDEAMKERFDWIMAERHKQPGPKGPRTLREALKAAAEARKSKAKLKARKGKAIKV